MGDSEDWRRQRAEELRLFDPGPLAARPAREPRPVVDGVEPMRRPVTPPVELPLADAASPPLSEVRRGAEPAERRFRPQSPLLSGTAVVETSGVAAPSAPHASGSTSFAARHPMILGAVAAAALAGAGALGWMVRDRIEPLSVVTTAMTHPAPPVSTAPALEQPTPAPLLANTTLPISGPERNAVGVPPAGAPANHMSRLAPVPVPVIKPPLPGDDGASPTKKTSQLVRAAPLSIVRRSPAAGSNAVKAKPAHAPMSPNDPTSRFAHPAKAVALPGRGFAPSFNCRRAIAAVNRAICASPELSALDRQVSQSFYRATANVDLDRHKAIDRDQVDFLNHRARCSSDDCVAGVYRQRLDALRQGAPGE